MIHIDSTRAHCPKHFIIQGKTYFKKHLLNNVNCISRQVFNLLLVVCRKRYRHYLGRPDIKQELLSQWQKDFNSIPDDMRDSEDTKAELHLRLDVRRLCKYSITDLIFLQLLMKYPY